MSPNETPSAQNVKPADPPDANWEALFYAPGKGLVTMLEGASSHKELDKILTAVIQSLVNRKDENETRDGYLVQAKEIVNPENHGLDTAKQEAVLLLLQIKKHRTEKQQQAKQEAEQPAGTEPKESPKTPIEEAPAPKALDLSKAEDFLIDYLGRSIQQRLNVLALPPHVASNFKGEVPFVLSSDFASHLGNILQARILPALIPLLGSLKDKLENMSVEDREGFMAENIDSRDYWGPIWEAWQTSWEKRTQIQPIPKKPANLSKGGMFNKLVDKVKDKPGEKKKMTEEEWKKKITRIHKGNARAEKIWGNISRESEDYLAPEEADNKVLMNLLSQSVTDLEDRMKAIVQIVSQGGSARTFDAYVKSRDVDLVLLACCYQRPELFLKAENGGDGGQPKQETAPVAEESDEDKKDKDTEPVTVNLDSKSESFLKSVLRGYREDARKKKFPLVSRFAYPIAE